MKEVFIGLTYLDDMGARSITESIVNCVEVTMKLSLNNCLSSTFDGASTMSGSITGVQTKLKNHNSRILYTHCFNHVLNLCLVDTVKFVDNARLFFALLQSVYIFISGSAVHVKFIEMQKEHYPSNRRIVQLKNQCETRWAYLALSIERQS